MQRFKYTAHDLRDLCSQCWKHPTLPGYDRCLPCQGALETLRLVAGNDQLDAYYQERLAPPSDDGFATDSHY